MTGLPSPNGPPPAALPYPTDPGQVPAELAGRPQWVAWYWKPTGRPEKPWTKPPVDPKTGRPAKADDPTTWGTFDQAVAWAQRHHLAGIGIVLTPDLGIAGVDLDGCRDPETGALAGWAQAVVDRLDTLTLVSPSRTGLRAFLKGRLPAWLLGLGRQGRRTGPIEVYQGGHYLTLTTEHVPGTPERLEARQDELEAWLADVFPRDQRAVTGRPGGRPAGPVPVADAALLEMVFASRNGAAIRRLWDGELGGHGNDHSGADQALCNHLAFWTDRDAARIDRLFRCSGLYREKWERADYRERTIAKAIADCAEGYRGPADDLDLSQLGQTGATWHGDRVDGAGLAPEDAAAGGVTLADAVAVFGAWLHLEDAGPIYVVLGALAANVMDGDPVWAMLVGPSSGGKTEVLNAVTGLPRTHPVGTLTEGALLSGTPKRDKDRAAKGGLLREVGPFGVLVVKDFTSILSMNRDPRAQLLAALREIYDGRWTRHVGVDGGRTLAWEGKLGILAGCTAAVDSFHAVMATMGERFLLYRLPAIDPAEQATRALRNAGREREMRTALAAAVTGLFRTTPLPDRPPALDERETARLVALASLAARARSGVERDPRTREIELIFDHEAPARLAQTLRRLYGGMLAIGLDRPTAWTHTFKAGLDCLPKVRRGVFDVLAAAGEGICESTTEVAGALDYPTTTARRALEDLTVHGVVDRIPAVKGGLPDQWRLTAWAWERYRASVPEMSVPR